MTDADGATRRELAVELLKAYRHYVGLGAIVALALLWYIGVPTPEITITRPQKVALVAILSAGALGYLPAAKVLDWLYNPPRRYLVQSGYTADEAGIWELTPAQFEELDVIDGELYQWPGTKYPTYEVEEYDPDTNRAIATWRGSKPDSHLIDREQDIDELRETLEQKAKERDILVTRAERIVREVILDNTRTLIKEYNRSSLVDVGTLSDKIDDALSEATLTEDLHEQQERKTDPETAGPDPRNEPNQPTRAATDGGNDE